MSPLNRSEALAAFSDIDPFRVAEQFGGSVNVRPVEVFNEQEDLSVMVIRIEGEIAIGDKIYALHKDINPKYMTVDYLCRSLSDAEQFIMVKLGQAVQNVSAEVKR